MASDGTTTAIQSDGLRDWTASVYERAGLSAQDARLLADTIVEADLRGVYSHGVSRVGFYLVRLERGGLNPRPNVRVVRDTVATALIDGDHGMGQVVSQAAMDVALDKAAKVGTSYVTVFNSGHNGAEAYWAMQALPRDMIGIASTLSSGNIMAPWGGRTALLGTNPIAYAIPADQEMPIVLDLATSVVAKGKIMVAAKEGRPIPADWAMDREGRPTTDAQEAMLGLVQPLGGYKGYGLCFVFGMLGGVLGGADFGENIKDVSGRPDAQQNVGHFFQAIDISVFRPAAEFKRDVDRAIQSFKASERAAGVNEIFMPGEIEFRRREQTVRDGIGLGPGVLGELDAIGERMGLGPVPRG
jgi:LDH2 family malate/lactate/ureidoglycolate dehydrogenase